MTNLINVNDVNTLACYSLTYKNIDINTIASYRLKSAELRNHLCNSNISCVILATCLRFEVYIHSLDRFYVENYLKNFFGELWSKVEKFYGVETIYHVFEVASGLHSQIIGEWEILEQVEYAFTNSKELRCTTQLIDKLFEKAVSVGRKIREQIMNLDKDSKGYPQIALEILSNDLKNLNNKGILFVGSGHAVRKAIKYLLNVYKPNIILIVDSNYEKTINVSSICRELCVPISIDDLFKWIHLIDGVFIAISNRDEEFLKKIKYMIEILSNRNVSIVDISTPSVIEKNRNNVYIFHDVQRFVEKLSNSIDLERIRMFIENEVNVFLVNLKKYEMRDHISSLMKNIEIISEKAGEKLARELNVNNARKELIITAFKNHAHKIFTPILEMLIKLNAYDTTFSKCVDFVFNYLEEMYNDYLVN